MRIAYRLVQAERDGCFVKGNPRAMGDLLDVFASSNCRVIGKANEVAGVEVSESGPAEWRTVNYCVNGLRARVWVFSNCLLFVFFSLSAAICGVGGGEKYGDRVAYVGLESGQSNFPSTHKRTVAHRPPLSRRRCGWFTHAEGPGCRAGAVERKELIFPVRSVQKDVSKKGHAGTGTLLMTQRRVGMCSGNWLEGSQVSKARPGAPIGFTL
jgi:hypothetical protein